MQFAASMLHIYTAASKQHGDSVYRSLVKLLFSDVAHARTMAHVNVDFFWEWVMKLGVGGFFAHNSLPLKWSFGFFVDFLLDL